MLRTRADRWLEGTSLGSLAVHVIALLTMAGVLLPAMPGAGLPTAAERLAYVLAHPLLWHLAWLPWHLCAASDVLLSAALVRVKWVPRWLSITTLGVTLVAAVLEQRWEVPWNLKATGFASGAAYAGFEQQAALAVTVYAAALYGLMAIGWSCCVWFAREQRRPLVAVGLVAWPALLFASLAPLLPGRVPAALIQAGNKLGFTLLILWYGLALEAVLRRDRVDAEYGGMPLWRAPKPGVYGWCCEAVVNSRALRFALSFFRRSCGKVVSRTW